MSIEYTWTLMHGDADHFDNKKLILENPNDIRFFDSIIEADFDRYECKGITYTKKIIDLFKRTTYFDTYLFTETDEQIMDNMNDILFDFGYLASDCTCDGYHYADIRDIEKKKYREMITITKEEYDYLIERDELLEALEAAGVDNWGGWDDAMEILHGDNPTIGIYGGGGDDGIEKYSERYDETN